MIPVHEGSLSCHCNKVDVLVVLSDNNFVSDSKGGTLKLWDICTEFFLKKFTDNYGPVYGIAKVNYGIFVIFDRYQIKKPTDIFWDLGNGVCLKNYI